MNTLPRCLTHMAKEQVLNVGWEPAEAEFQGFMVILMWPVLPHSMVAGISRGEK